MMNMGVMYDDHHVEEQLVLALLGKEYAFGLIAPSKSRFPVSYHVQTLTKMKACKIPFAGLKIYLSSDKSALQKIILANDLIANAFMRQQWIMNTNKIYDRVQRALLVLNTVEGRGWNRIPLNITHEDLAEIVNADRPSVTLGLKKLQSQGLIELGYGKIWLNNELDFFSTLDGTWDANKYNTLSRLPLVQ
ncbi:Crp/Fnr family transcriptional regulator [Desulfitobacterium chlororespirans]|uniref:cAMP-binding domain of CRP or a regulatory subunit of cAMP-dependent protein kinases n=1 Tax=Desulfitobacterium chlororespirans DSM 11544 TaxID=1121395 RepID=A0A1M7SJH3_9FIRM|nr:Crp/Fnr family transcriptional regulator [Desulfitobacterium chlororespirans]SHN58589.1 cAMP-binding domain of CRP or a regulatory subunit of cAMP-dependent protein kinases [Desulfitobacterium chlororespirans DSM 11544]